MTGDSQLGEGVRESPVVADEALEEASVQLTAQNCCGHPSIQAYNLWL